MKLGNHNLLKMKTSNLLLLAVAAVFWGTGCLNEDNRIPENCFDGILNNGEELIDCGGPICDACDPCENGQYDVLLGEQWVDCGGECGPCDPSFNGVQDPGETGIDCGGDTGVACGELCGDGLLNGNEAGVDCGGPDCDACPTCTDDEMNGAETGVDCGGPDCEPCAGGSDCTNGVIDGDELYIDCGGIDCPVCEPVLVYKANGTTVECLEAQTTCTITGGTITINGLSANLHGINMVLPEPVVGWVEDATILCNPESMNGEVVNYVNPSAEQSSTTMGGAVTVTITYCLPQVGGIIVGTFAGTVQDANESNTSLSQGSFVLPIN